MRLAKIRTLWVGPQLAKERGAPLRYGMYGRLLKVHQEMHLSMVGAHRFGGAGAKAIITLRIWPRMICVFEPVALEG
jgi:hypothetical protein